MEIISDYYYMPFPYMSKSSLSTYNLCKYKFKRTVLEGVDPLQNKLMAEGTSVHYLFNKFFDLVERDKLEKMDWRQNSDTEYSAIYCYFLELLLSLTPEAVLTQNVMSSCKSFARLEENHWYFVKEKYTSLNEAWRMWWVPPGERERHIVNHDFQLFGTYDRIIREDEKIIIADYKSGKRPKKLVEEKRTGVYTKELPTKYVQEGNMYVLLYILNTGYTLKQDEKGIYHFFTPSGLQDDDVIKRFDYQIVFVGNDFSRFPTYEIGRKKSNMRSINSLIRKSKEAREQKEFPREPFYKKCQFCHLYDKECREVLELEIYGNVQQSENTTEEDVFFDE